MPTLVRNLARMKKKKEKRKKEKKEFRGNYTLPDLDELVVLVQEFH